MGLLDAVVGALQGAVPAGGLGDIGDILGRLVRP